MSINMLCSNQKRISGNNSSAVAHHLHTHQYWTHLKPLVSNGHCTSKWGSLIATPNKTVVLLYSTVYSLPLFHLVAARPVPGTIGRNLIKRIPPNAHIHEEFSSEAEQQCTGVFLPGPQALLLLLWCSVNLVLESVVTTIANPPNTRSIWSQKGNGMFGRMCIKTDGNWWQHHAQVWQQHKWNVAQLSIQVWQNNEPIGTTKMTFSVQTLKPWKGSWSTSKCDIFLTSMPMFFMFPTQQSSAQSVSTVYWRISWRLQSNSQSLIKQYSWDRPQNHVVLVQTFQNIVIILVHQSADVV